MHIAEGLPPEVADETTLDLFGLVTDLAAGTERIPCDGLEVRIVEHPTHARGHAALLIEECGVLVAVDTLSDLPIPMLDGTADALEDYLVGLRLLADVADGFDGLVPGHGSVAQGDEIRARVAPDLGYMHALRDGRAPDDPRLGPSAKPGWEWVSDIHEGQAQRLAAGGEGNMTPDS
ncbi:hypothetical protein ACFYWS_25850 [Streptomyces sp. NPDC002795]|uniref:hypothetical protein n=1 Tax=Streptomyces sp. NPDC002795 TaxID=3364665 RepID=UPI0036A6E2B7